MTDVSALHEEYLGCVKRFLGERWGGDRGITVTAAEYLVDFLQERRPKVVLEMGTGFSTLVLRQAAARTGTVVFSAEHDPVWLGFVRGLVSTRPALDQGHFYTIEQVKRRVQTRGSRFDAVFVDHGPTWEARLDDISWCRGALAPSGILILDDWYPSGTRAYRKYTRPATARLRRLGMRISVPGESHRDGDRKALCTARR